MVILCIVLRVRCFFFVCETMSYRKKEKVDHFSGKNQCTRALRFGRLGLFVMDDEKTENEAQHVEVVKQVFIDLLARQK